MEAANGEGPHINILAAFEGCPVEAHPEFSQILKSNFLSIFGKPETVNTVQLRQNIGKMVSANVSLIKLCNLHT